VSDVLKQELSARGELSLEEVNDYIIRKVKSICFSQFRREQLIRVEKLTLVPL
jgi:hypothetical protein